MKFTIKFTDDDGRVVIDIEDREVKVEDVYTAIPQLMAEFSDAIGEPILPYMTLGLSLAAVATELGYPASVVQHDVITPYPASVSQKEV